MWLNGMKGHQPVWLAMIMSSIRTHCVSRKEHNPLSLKSHIITKLDLIGRDIYSAWPPKFEQWMDAMCGSIVRGKAHSSRGPIATS